MIQSSRTYGAIPQSFVNSPECGGQAQEMKEGALRVL